MTLTEFADKWADRPVNGEDDARLFLADALAAIGGGFHPDDPMGEYVDFRTSTPCFTNGRAEGLDLRLREVFEVTGRAGTDPYEVCLSIERGQRPSVSPPAPATDADGTVPRCRKCGSAATIVGGIPFALEMGPAPRGRVSAALWVDPSELSCDLQFSCLCGEADVDEDGYVLAREIAGRVAERLREVSVGVVV